MELAKAETASEHIVGISDMEHSASKKYNREYLPAYRVRMGSEYQGSYDDLRDAIAAGKLLRSDHPTGAISVIDITSGFLVIDID